MASLRTMALRLPFAGARTSFVPRTGLTLARPAAAISVQNGATFATYQRSLRLTSTSREVAVKCSAGLRGFATSSMARQEENAPQQERELDDGEKNIVGILKREYQPELLQVQDVSGGCGSFYAIVIASHRFKGVPTIKAHRMVNESLKEVISGIHGLQLRTMPADDAKFD